MHHYQLLALDMDGTLLTSDKRISPRTLEAIRQATARGVAVALSTGRALIEIDEYRGALRGAIRYASLSSGGHLFDLAHNQTIAARTFETSDALAIAEYGLDRDAMVHVMTTTQSVATRADVDRMDQLGMGVYQDMFRSICTYVDDIRPFIAAHPGEVCKINLYHPSSEARDLSLQQLPKLEAQVARAEQTSLEFSPAGVSKALGLQLLCDHLRCTLGECVAVGDSFNDLDALEAAGLAVAMGNAPEEVKARADAVVADNDHDGIVEVIERWFL